MIAPYFRRISLCLIAATSSLTAGEFRTFPLTLSPDGGYLLAWGDKSGSESDLATMTEVTDDKPHFDLDSDALEDFLVATGKKVPVAVIPGFEYFAGPEGRQNHRDLSVAWTQDSSHALLIYHGRYGYESVLWLDVAKRKFTSIGEPMEAAARKAMGERESKKLLDFATSMGFWDVAFATPDTLVVTASATSAGDKDAPLVDFSYRVRFKITEAKGKVSVKLLEAKVLEEEAGKNEKPESLEATLERLAAKLGAAGATALREEQARWVKHRDALKRESDREDFTRQRRIELAARVDGW